MRTLAAWCFVGTMALASRVGAQASPRPRATTPTDSIFMRARQLVVNGNGAAGRLLVDSVIAATNPDTPVYADALYWRAALAASSIDAELDYKRVVVEFPLSERAGDALFQLAQLEIARGDRAAAITHLDRFLLENPSSDDRGRAGLMLVRLAFDQNEPQHACGVLRRALQDVPSAEVELRNQLDYFSPRCVNVDSTRLDADEYDSARYDAS
jgi:TolA-binding protein